MPNITPLQQDFSAGELSPDLYAQFNAQRGEDYIYQSGAKAVTNFIIDPRGPLRNRVGFRYLGNVIAQPIAPPGLNCSQAELLSADEYGDGVAGTNNYGALRWIWFDPLEPENPNPARNSIVFTLSRSGTLTDTVFEVLGDDSVTPILDLQVTGSSGLVSPPGQIGQNTYLSVSSQGVGGDRNIRYFFARTLGESYNFVLNQDRSTSFLCECEDYVAYWQSAFTTIIIIRKSTWTWHSVADPAGWEFPDPAAIRRSELSFTVPLREDATGNYTFFAYNELNTPDVINDRLADVDPAVQEFYGVGFGQNNKFFWPVRIGGLAQILVTDVDGNEITKIDIESGANWADGFGSQKFTPDEDGNHFFFLHAGFHWRINSVDYTIEKCQVDEIDPVKYGFTPGTYQAGDFIYMADPRDQGGNRVFAKQKVF